MYNPTDHAAFSPVRVSKKAQMVREVRLLAAPTVNKSYKQYLIPGKQVDVPTISTHLSVRSVGAGATYNPESVAVTTTSITINNDMEASVVVDDRLPLESVVEVADLLIKDMGYAHAKNIDTVLLAHYSDAPAANQQALTAGSKMTEPALRDMEVAFDNGLVPSEDRFVFFSPSQRSALQALTEFRSKDFIGPEEANKGTKFGELPSMLLSFTALWTSQVPSSTTLVSGQTSRAAVFWQREAIALCMEKEFSVDKRRALRAFAWDYASRTIFADKTMRADHIGYIASL